MKFNDNKRKSKFKVQSDKITTAPLTEKKCGYFQVNPDVTTIYVGNLKYNKTEKQVQELFGRFGSVKYSKIVLDPKTGKGKGIAFVQMPNKKHAREAIEKLNGTQIDGRTLKVSVASERNPEKFEEIRAARSIAKAQSKNVTPEVNTETQKPRPSRRKRDKGLKLLFNHLES